MPTAIWSAFPPAAERATTTPSEAPSDGFLDLWRRHGAAQPDRAVHRQPCARSDAVDGGLPVGGVRARVHLLADRQEHGPSPRAAGSLTWRSVLSQPSRARSAADHARTAEQAWGTGRVTRRCRRAYAAPGYGTRGARRDI